MINTVWALSNGRVINTMPETSETSEISAIGHEKPSLPFVPNWLNNCEAPASNSSNPITNTKTLSSNAGNARRMIPRTRLVVPRGTIRYAIFSLGAK